MRVCILGSGLMGGKLGTIFARAGQEVVFSQAWGNDKLNDLVRIQRQPKPVSVSRTRPPPLLGAELVRRRRSGGPYISCGRP